MYRVEEVRTDSVFVRKSADEVENAGVMALVKFQTGSGKEFTGERIGYARKELLDLEARGPIHGVERKRTHESAQ